MPIVNHMQGLLNRPFTMSARQKAARNYVLTFALLLPIFLYIQQPYGINTWHHTEKLLPLTGFAVIFLSCYLITHDSLPALFTNYFSPTNWTVGRDIQTFLIFIIILGLFNWLYAAFLLEEIDQDFRSWLRVEFETFTYALLPKALLVAITWSTRLPKNTTPEEKTEPETVLCETQNTEPEPELIRVESAPEEETSPLETEMSGDKTEETPDSKTEVIFVEAIPNALKYINPEQIIYIKSDRNNSCIHQLVNGKSIEQVVRLSLVGFEKYLAGKSSFVRCSKSHIVNTRYIDQQQSRNMKRCLKLLHCDELIPVSTTFVSLPLQAWKEE